MQRYKPEGEWIITSENAAAMRNLASLHEAMREGRILEAIAYVCDQNKNLHVDLGTMRGIIPRSEGALGIDTGDVRDIAVISRVNKPVCFKIIDITSWEDGQPVAILSRRQVQAECMEHYISRLVPGDIIDACVTHIEPFGAFVDIGCGVPSLVPIDAISVSRISHPSDRFVPGQRLKVIVKSVAGGRVFLSHKELLGTWMENASLFTPNSTVSGIVRSVEDYGIFVELTPNLSGLAEPKEGVKPGQRASVFIKSIIPEKMKIKLIIIDAFEREGPHSPMHYYFQDVHISRWRYSPEVCEKLVESVFEPG